MCYLYILAQDYVICRYFLIKVNINPCDVGRRSSLLHGGLTTERENHTKQYSEGLEIYTTTTYTILCLINLIMGKNVNEKHFFIVSL